MLTKSWSEPANPLASRQSQLPQYNAVRQSSLQQDPVQHNLCEIQSTDACTIVTASPSTPPPSNEPLSHRRILQQVRPQLGVGLFCKTIDHNVMLYNNFMHGVCRF